MHGDSFSKTEELVAKWTSGDIPKTGWTLRRIFSCSAYFETIADGAMRRSGYRLSSYARSRAAPGVRWWSFHMEKLDEQQAVNLMYRAWKEDVPKIIEEEARVASESAVKAVFERVRIARQFDEMFDAYPCDDQTSENVERTIEIARRRSDAGEGGSLQS